MRRGNVLENLIDFGAVLRAHGLHVHTGRLIDVAQALQQIDLGSRDEVFHTCRTLLIHRHEDFAIFDRVVRRVSSTGRRPIRAEARPKADERRRTHGRR